MNDYEKQLLAQIGYQKREIEELKSRLELVREQRDIFKAENEKIIEVNNWHSKEQSKTIEKQQKEIEKFKTLYEQSERVIQVCEDDISQKDNEIRKLNDFNVKLRRELHASDYECLIKDNEIEQLKKEKSEWEQLAKDNAIENLSYSDENAELKRRCISNCIQD